MSHEPNILLPLDESTKAERPIIRNCVAHLASPKVQRWKPNPLVFPRIVHRRVVVANYTGEGLTMRPLLLTIRSSASLFLFLLMDGRCMGSLLSSSLIEFIFTRSGVRDSEPIITGLGVGDPTISGSASLLPAPHLPDSLRVPYFAAPVGRRRGWVMHLPPPVTMSPPSRPGLTATARHRQPCPCPPQAQP